MRQHFVIAKLITWMILTKTSGKSVAYRFALRQPAGTEFQRIALEQIDRILGDWTAPEDRDAAVHGSRKSLKRLRALSRLARPALGEDAFKSFNSRFRDVGLLFAQDRDRRVLLDTVLLLEKKLAPKAAVSLVKIKDSLRTPPADGGNGHVPEDEAGRLLRALRKDIAGLDVDEMTSDSIEQGLKDGYRRGRKLLREVYASPSDEGFHDLRKSVQHQWRHMQLLSRAWPDLVAARITAARKVSQLLGDDHDLSVLRTHVLSQPKTLITARQAKMIDAAIAERQARLRLRAQPLCEQIYTERSGRFANRMFRLWRAAEDLSSREAMMTD